MPTTILAIVLLFIIYFCAVNTGRHSTDEVGILPLFTFGKRNIQGFSGFNVPQQVDVAGVQPFESLVDSVIIFVEGWPELGLEEDVFLRNTRFPDSAAYSLFIDIGVGCNETVSALESAEDGSFRWLSGMNPEATAGKRRRMLRIMYDVRQTLIFRDTSPACPDPDSRLSV